MDLEAVSASLGENTMKRTLKSRLWMSVAVVAVLAGITAAAVMAAQPAAPHPHAHHRDGDSLLATAASYLKATPAQLKSELQSGKSLAEIANATRGKSEAGLVEALETAEKHRLATVTANLSARIAAKVDRPGWDVGRTDPAIRAASSYLDLSVTQLRSELRSGKTPAEIAKATSGKSEVGLIEALMAVVKARLVKEVQAGSITQAQANAQLPKLASRIASRVNRAERERGTRAGVAFVHRSPATD